MRRLFATVFLGACTPLMLAPSAVAHRCDSCFTKRSGPPGTTVVITRAYRVIWNGAEVTPQGPSVGPYHPHRPSPTLLDLVKPKRHARIRIPDVPPGVYSLIAYDGSEAGTHYIWTTFRVRPSSTSLASTGGSFLGVSAATLVLLVVAIGLTTLARGKS
jgi:hypothetical protein